MSATDDYPDRNCYTLPNGECVSDKKCLHSPSEVGYVVVAVDLNGDNPTTISTSLADQDSRAELEFTNGHRGGHAIGRLDFRSSRDYYVSTAIRITLKGPMINNA